MLSPIMINLAIVVITLDTTNGRFNGNTPPMVHLSRNWILRETDPIGYIVDRVQAQDDEQSEFEYGLEVKNDGVSSKPLPPLPFNINNNTGVITLNNTLEGQGGQTMSLYVTVSDGKFIAKSEVYVNIQHAVNSNSEIKRPSTVNQRGNVRFPVIRLPSTIFTTTQPQQSLRTHLKGELMNVDLNKIDRKPVNSLSDPIISTRNSTLPLKVEPSVAPLNQNSFMNLTSSSIICAIILCLGIGTWSFRKYYYSNIKITQDTKWNPKTAISEIKNESLELQRSQSNKHLNVWKSNTTNSNKNVNSGNGFDAWEFPRHKLKIFAILGEGCFGQVWKCEALDMNPYVRTTTVAVKTLRDNASEHEKLDFLEELKMMKNLEPHPNVVRLLGCCTERDPIFIILEYISGGKLQTFLRTSREGWNQGCLGLTSQDLTSFVYQVAKGMENLASKCIIHRDLAARNVLIDENRVCKVADFGFARDIANDQVYQRKSEGKLPIRWMAPESLFDNIFSVKSDVWSFGILIWEIVTLGSTPYPGLAATEVIKRIKEGYRLDRPEHCKRELYNIMYYCWNEKPLHRPSFSELVMLSETLLLNETDYIELDRFPDHSYYNVINLSGEKL